MEENIVTASEAEVQDATSLQAMQDAFKEIDNIKNNVVNNDHDPIEDNAESTNSDDEQDKQLVDESDSSDSREDAKTQQTQILDTKDQEKSDKEEKLWKERKRKYQTIAEKEALMAENEELKRMLKESLSSGTYHYGKNVHAEMEHAKAIKKQAIEEGDIDGLVEADIKLTKAISAVNELEKWSASEEQKNKQSKSGSNADASSHDNHDTRISIKEREQEMAQDWLEEHPELIPTSPMYDKEKAKQVGGFINYLDQQLAQTGNSEAYYSDEYFGAIEDYMQNLPTQTPQVAKASKPASNNHIGGVRNSYNSSVNGKANEPTRITLSADEKRMCANAGIAEKEWLKFKIEDIQNNQKN